MRADNIIRDYLREAAAWNADKSMDSWLRTRSAGWLAPNGEFHRLGAGEHHKEWVQKPATMFYMKEVLAQLQPHQREHWPTVRGEMMKQGWVQKLDHDQYAFQPADFVASLSRHQWSQRVMDHFNTHHPDENHYEVAIEHPQTGAIKRHYFHRNPDTGYMMSRSEWKGERSKQSPLVQKTKWSDPLSLG